MAIAATRQILDEYTLNLTLNDYIDSDDDGTVSNEETGSAFPFAHN